MINGSERLDPSPLIKSHFRALDGRIYHGAEEHIRPSKGLKVVLLAVPVFVAIICFIFQIRIQQPSMLLAAFGFFGSGSLAAFGQMSTTRNRITDSQGTTKQTPEATRGLVDEASIHMLTATFLTAIAAAGLLLVALLQGVGPSLSEEVRHWLHIPWIALQSLLIGLFAWIFEVYWIGVPRLFEAYVQLHKVTGSINANKEQPRSL